MTSVCKHCNEPIDHTMGRWVHQRRAGLKTTRCNNRNTVGRPFEISAAHLNWSHLPRVTAPTVWRPTLFERFQLACAFAREFVAALR
jgi:hypothetical protein